VIGRVQLGRTVDGVTPILLSQLGLGLLDGLRVLAVTRTHDLQPRVHGCGCEEAQVLRHESVAVLATASSASEISALPATRQSQVHVRKLAHAAVHEAH
jgi:hypothetical protein